MPTVSLYNQEGKAVGDIALSDDVFAVRVNPAVLHQVVRIQLANRRQGTQSALTRAEVSGGGRKPWRQKGTGRARQGSTRSPQWRHGGVVFAPKPRDYSMDIPKKMRRLALRGALTSKVEDGTIVVLDKIALEAPKTKLVANMLKNLSVSTKALLVTKDKDEAVYRAGRNIEGLKIATVSTLSVLDILGYDRFIVTQEAARHIEEVYA